MENTSGNYNECQPEESWSITAELKASNTASFLSAKLPSFRNTPFPKSQYLCLRDQDKDNTLKEKDPYVQSKTLVCLWYLLVVLLLGLYIGMLLVIRS